MALWWLIFFLKVHVLVEVLEAKTGSGKHEKRVTVQVGVIGFNSPCFKFYSPWFNFILRALNYERYTWHAECMCVCALVYMPSRNFTVSRLVSLSYTIKG